MQAIPLSFAALQDQKCILSAFNTFILSGMDCMKLVLEHTTDDTTQLENMLELSSFKELQLLLEPDTDTKEVSTLALDILSYFVHISTSLQIVRSLDTGNLQHTEPLLVTV